MKTLLATAIAATFATTAAFAGQDSTNDPSIHLDQRVNEGEQRSEAYDEDNTSDLRHEPCPDKFDKAWAKTNDANEPCLDPQTAELRMPDGSEYIAESDMETEDTEIRTAIVTEPEPSDYERIDRTSEELCEEEDLSNQAVAYSTYESELDMLEDGEKMEISADFDPNASTAKSVDQLRDSDIEQTHLDATFAAIDDDNSGGVNQVESLGVRGLADIFDELDLNDDRVVSNAEFDLYFDGELDDPFCLDGERITSIDDVDVELYADVDVQ